MRTARLVLLLLAAEGKKAAATRAAFKDTAIIQLCEVGMQLAKAPAVALAKYKVLTGAATAARAAEMLSNQAAAANAGENSSTLFKAIALAADRCANEATKRLEDFAPVSAKAALTGRKLSGAISEMAEFLRQISYKTAADNYCLGTAAAATAAKTLTELGCPSFEDITLPDDVKYDTNVITPSGFAKLTPSSIKQTGTASTKCVFLKGAADAASVLWRETEPEGLKILAGFVDLTPHETANSEDATMATLNSGAQNGRFPDAANDAAKTAFNTAQELNEFSTDN
uniref:Variant surface glycoprotein 1125.5562 n=1 Tax=Trypanosoma brucei TaxID=5691 RepID=A0A1J0RCW8_9TRYP|nr:variant surface glycoprotein 1125.5562 [Trypanosoma brucei]